MLNEKNPMPIGLRFDAYKKKSDAYRIFFCAYVFVSYCI